jgi:hypothetical protein
MGRFYKYKDTICFSYLQIFSNFFSKIFQVLKLSL